MSSPDKPQLRAALRRQRRHRPAPPDAALLLAQHALAQPGVAAADTVAAYVALPGEPDVELLVAALRERGVRVLLPVVPWEGSAACLPAAALPAAALPAAAMPAAALNWAIDTGPAHRHPGRLGIPIPVGPVLPPSALAQAQVVFLPALALDLHGHRLGQGAGWYDRSLPYADPHALLVGVIHPQELLDELPTQPHDVPVHAALSHTGWQTLGRQTQRNQTLGRQP